MEICAAVGGDALARFFYRRLTSEYVFLVPMPSTKGLRKNTSHLLLPRKKITQKCRAFSRFQFLENIYISQYFTPYCVLWAWCFSAPPTAPCQDVILHLKNPKMSTLDNSPKMSGEIGEKLTKN